MSRPARLRSALAAASPASEDERTPAVRTPAVRTLVVWCPDWPVTAAGCPAGEEVAVVAANRVVAASAAARAEGVRAGQRRREAQACCPALRVLARDPGAEVRAFEPVVQALESFGVPVAVRSPGWAALATRGPARRHGGEAALREAVEALLAGQLPPGAWHTGLADGVFSATLAARTPGGLVVAHRRNAAFLEPLAVELIGRPDLADLLRRLGITTLGDFGRLDERDVLARFGTDGAEVHRLARGLDERLLEGRRVPPDLAVAIEIDPPAERVDEAAFAARSLSVSLCERLSASGLACGRLAVEVTLDTGEELRRVWEHDGAWSPALVAERVRWQLEAWITGASLAGSSERRGAREHGGVGAVRLVPLEVVPDRGRQPSLWAGPSDAGERVARAAARVQGMLGAEAVLRPVFAGGRGPAERVRLVPFGDPLPSGAEAPWPGCLPLPSPTAIAEEDGEEVDLLDGSGARVAVDGRGELSASPAQLVTGGYRRPVVGWSAPWPVDERWWDGRTRRRRARLQVSASGGDAYLLYLERGTWRLAGSYD